jgi:CBS-domain-containing membrane protein
MNGMTVADVMTQGAVTATVHTPYRTLIDLIETRAVNAVPVVDSYNRVVGVVSASDLLHKIEFAGDADPPRIFESRKHRRDRRKSAAMTAAELMSAPAVTVMKTTPVADAARLMEEAGVRRLPVIDLAGRLIGIVTNRDLLKVFLRPDDAIKRHVLDLFATVDGGTESVLAVEVDDGDVAVTGEVDRRSVAESLTRRIGAIDGVVSVVNRVTWLVDDTVNAMPVAGY